MASARPAYLGARWWKLDVHTHTPASQDWRGAADFAPEDWLLAFMRAEIDAVVVTDHNSGAWIDRLEQTYVRMAAEHEAGRAAVGFRALTLFPGVEISASSGVHVLAVLDPSASTSDIDALLGRVDYRGKRGHCDGVTSRSLEDVVRVVLDTGAIPIPAHADQPKGLLECRVGRESMLDPTTLRQVLSVEGLLAVEWCDANRAVPQCAEPQLGGLARVLGSDWHGLDGPTEPGQRFTWVKMGAPTLEGLRLALLDGNGVSIRRSDDGAFDPDALPEHRLAAIEIHDARYMGRGRPARIELSPFFNAVVGGRGTGKSTLVHALRLAMGRGDDLPEEGEPRAQFESFRRLPKRRADPGALREDSIIAVEWCHDADRFRITWKAGGAATVVEAWDGHGWRATESQAVHAERFPLQILSQGEIGSIAGRGRRTLLQIVDRAAGVGPLRAELNDAVRTFHEQRARQRSLEGKLADEPEVDRKLGEIARKLEAFQQSRHAEVLRAFARTGNQRRELVATFNQVEEAARRIDELAQDIALDDWSSQHFLEEHDLLAWRTEVDAAIAGVRADLRARAELLRATLKTLGDDPRVQQWKTRWEKARKDHAELSEQLAGQGVQDPGAFERLTREHQQLQERKKELSRVRSDRDALVGAIDAQRALIAARRAAITDRRQSFLRDVLGNNAHVRMTVVPYGFDPRQIERELRELLDVMDERFAGDILVVENGEPRHGLAFDLANASDKPRAIEHLRERLRSRDSLGANFQKFLERKAAQPEFEDHLLAWTPEDDLRIEYERHGHWQPIEQGSQGQRSAALLAFLLAFGSEPLVLDQPEDDLDNQLIYDLIVRQIRENKLRRQLVIVTHNPNVVVNGDAELVHVMDFVRGQCVVRRSGVLQENEVREEVCRVMEGGHEAFARRWKRLGREG